MEVGDKVVCVNAHHGKEDHAYHQRYGLPVVGEIYTIRSTYKYENASYVSVRLKQIDNSHLDPEPAFPPAWFKVVQTSNRKDKIKDILEDGFQN